MLINKNVPISFQVLEADSTDIDWVTRVYIDDARNGNFGYDVKDNSVTAVLRSNIRSIIKRRKMKDSGRETQTIIFQQNRVRVGFCIMAQIIGQPHAAELHMMLVSPSHRNKGYGHFMLAEIIGRFHPHVDLFARCYPGAVVMAALLKKHGFYACRTFDDGTDLYQLIMAQPVQGAIATYRHSSIVNILEF